MSLPHQTLGAIAVFALLGCESAEDRPAAALSASSASMDADVVDGLNDRSTPADVVDDGGAPVARDATADVSDGDFDAGVPMLQGLSFDLKFKGDGDFCQGYCDPTVLHVRNASEAKLNTIIGLPGRAEAATWHRIGTTWRLGEAVSLWSFVHPNYHTHGYVKLVDAQIQFDSSADALVLHGTGISVSQYASDDTSTGQHTRPFSVSGTLDSRAPRWIPPTLPDSPLEVLDLRLDEPLPDGAVAALEGPGETLPLTQTIDEGVVVGFTTDRIRRLQTSYSITSPTFDLAGFSAPIPGTSNTVDDPGFFPFDGFEGGSMAGVARVYGNDFLQALGVASDYLGQLPAISGERSLVVPPGNSVLIRMNRANETKVTLKVRKVIAGDGWLKITAGVVGGSLRSTADVALGDDVTKFNFGWTPFEAGPVQSIELSLQEPGVEVLLGIATECYNMSISRWVSAIVDDVRVE